MHRGYQVERRLAYVIGRHELPDLGDQLFEAGELLLRIARCVMISNHGSTWLSQEAKVGVWAGCVKVYPHCPGMAIGLRFSQRISLLAMPESLFSSDDQGGPVDLIMFLKGDPDSRYRRGFVICSGYCCWWSCSGS